MYLRYSINLKHCCSSFIGLFLLVVTLCSFISSANASNTIHIQNYDSHNAQKNDEEIYESLKPAIDSINAFLAVANVNMLYTMFKPILNINTRDKLTNISSNLASLELVNNLEDQFFTLLSQVQSCSQIRNFFDKLEPEQTTISPNHKKLVGAIIDSINNIIIGNNIIVTENKDIASNLEEEKMISMIELKNSYTLNPFLRKIRLFKSIPIILKYLTPFEFKKTALWRREASGIYKYSIANGKSLQESKKEANKYVEAKILSNILSDTLKYSLAKREVNINDPVVDFITNLFLKAVELGWRSKKDICDFRGAVASSSLKMIKNNNFTVDEPYAPSYSDIAKLISALVVSSCKWERNNVGELGMRQYASSPANACCVSQLNEKDGSSHKVCSDKSVTDTIIMLHPGQKEGNLFPKLQEIFTHIFSLLNFSEGFYYGIADMPDEDKQNELSIDIVDVQHNTNGAIVKLKIRATNQPIKIEEVLNTSNCHINWPTNTIIRPTTSIIITINNCNYNQNYIFPIAYKTVTQQPVNAQYFHGTLSFKIEQSKQGFFSTFPPTIKGNNYGILHNIGIRTVNILFNIPFLNRAILNTFPRFIQPNHKQWYYPLSIAFSS